MAASGSCRRCRPWCSACSQNGSAPPGLLAGWFVGFFGGTYLVWINGLKPLQMISLGSAPFTVYIGILALIANIVVAVVVNAVMLGRAVARA